METMK